MSAHQTMFGASTRLLSVALVLMLTAAPAVSLARAQQVLVLSDLSRAAYYGYLALYLAIFLLDDAIVFVTIMQTLRASGLASSADPSCCPYPRRNAI